MMAKGKAGWEVELLELRRPGQDLAPALLSLSPEIPFQVGFIPGIGGGLNSQWWIQQG